MVISPEVQIIGGPLKGEWIHDSRVEDLRRTTLKQGYPEISVLTTEDTYPDKDDPDQLGRVVMQLVFRNGDYKYINKWSIAIMPWQWNGKVPELRDIETLFMLPHDLDKWKKYQEDKED